MSLSDTILKRTEQSGKTYSFQDDHNPRLPAQHWFQETPEGPVLFLVMFTQACRWSQCLGCNLPSKMSRQHVSFQDVMKQVDFIFDYWLSEEQKKDLRKIILSNNGSILDEDTFSTTALVYFLAKMNMECPNVKTLTIETRPEYADMEELEILARVLKEGEQATNLELAIGFEAFDDTIRNDLFHKGLPIAAIKEFAIKIARHGFSLKTYFMLKPVPDMSEQDAVQDIKKGMDFLVSLASEHKLSINMHLNPTYAAYGTPLAVAFERGTFAPPTTNSLKEIILYAENKPLSLYIGMYDEGLSVPGGHTFHDTTREETDRFHAFNRSQDFTLFH